MPEITLGIPLYRSAVFLPELFARLRALHTLPREIIFLDDASPDASAQLAVDFVAEISTRTKARIVAHTRNLGIAAAYNRLIVEAKQSWVHILDADDYPVESDYYERVGTALADDVDLVVTALSGDTGIFRLTRGFARFVPRRPPAWWPLLGSFATRSGVIYRRESLRAVPFADPAFPGSDVIHLLTLRRHRGMAFLAAAHVYYRIHSEATSAQAQDYSQYLNALKSFGVATRSMHRIDLGLRRLGQWGTR